MSYTSLKSFAKDMYHRFLDHDLLGSAAELSYYFLFSLFPLLLFIVALAAYLPTQPLVDYVLARLSMIMPKEAMAVINDSLHNLVTQQRPRLLSLSVLAAVWSASRGTSAIMTRLAAAYGEPDRRSWLKFQAIAIGMTLASGVLLAATFAVLVLGGKVGYYLAQAMHTARYYSLLGSGLRWPLSAAVAMLIAAVNYYTLPGPRPTVRTVLPGTVVGTLLWFLCTWGFTKYTGHIGDYNATYGSLGGVIMLMTWLYLSGLSFLIGGEINAACAGPKANAEAPRELPRNDARQPR
jgi:membrane protein